ncbi:MAG: VPLPA-CTERM sorting domain-containing protein [Pseudomonadota bacterium]
MKRRFLFAAFVASVMVVAPAQGATLVTSGNGTALLGATSVNVDGALFDVSFQGGTYVDLFDGCDAPEDFMFTTQSAAAVAAQALLDEVFIGTFEDGPFRTRGCSDGGSCSAVIPYEYRVQNGFLGIEEDALFVRARNLDEMMLAPNMDGVANGLVDIDADLTGDILRVFALFTPSDVAVVPLPAAGWLMLGGLATLGAVGRRRG